jgi:hypothetical protein
MRIAPKWTFVGVVVSLALVSLMIGSLPIVQASADHVRWDIVSVNFVAPFTTSPGGIASATANNGSQITLTGSGTFVEPGGGDGTSSATTGGGTWKVFESGATTPSATGTYEVTGLVRWDPAPFPPGGPPPRTDLIDPTATRSTGLAVLRIAYSDGELGILVVSCTGVTALPSMFEGITATKGFVDYKSPVAPVGGVDANRTVFHLE